MKKVFVTVMILAIAVLLVACGGKDKDVTPTTPTAPAVTTPTAPTEPVAPVEKEDNGVVEAAPAEGDVDVLNKSDEILGGGEIEEIGSKVERVACDYENNKVTFTIVNVGEKSWQLNQEVPFPPPRDLTTVKVFINGYEANRGTPQYHPDTGEVMFGPNEKFSDNCAGVEVLEVGEEVECTLYPVKLNRGTGSDGLSKVNEIWIDSPSVDDYLEFVC